MKIMFEDGSFIDIDYSNREDKIAIFTMCGLNSNGKQLTMASSELDSSQTKKIIDFLQKMLKNCL